MPHNRGVIPVLEIGAIVKGLRQHLDGTHDYPLHSPRVVPLLSGLSHAHSIIGLRPVSQHRGYCQLPVSGRRLQPLLQFELGSHKLPVVLGHFAGGQHVARADRVCTPCGGVAVADEMHMIF